MQEYLKVEDGQPGEIVSGEYVERFTSPDTLRFFRGLGGRESVRRMPDGSVRVRSVSPDASIVRVVTFSPVGGEEA